MTDLQIHDITWQRQDENYFVPVLKFFDINSKEFKTIPLENYSFNFKLSEDKFCTGYNKDGYFQCPFNNKVGDNAKPQCSYCQKVEGFMSTFIMGDLSHERSDQILSQEYYIYLACFEPGVVKVGTANINRGNKRLIEQDALLYCFIAKGSGYKIQKLEHLISKQIGITETIKSNHKLKCVSHKPNLKLAEEKFQSYFHKIKEHFKNDSEYSDLFFEHFQIEDLTKTNEIFFPEKYKKFEDLNLFGTFKGLRGRYLFIESQNDIAAFDTNYLTGRFVDEYIEDWQYNFFEEQLSLL